MVSEVKDKVECDICGKKYKNLKNHKSMAHPESQEETPPPEQEPGETVVIIGVGTSVGTGEEPLVVETFEPVFEQPPDINEHPLVIELREKVSTMELIIENTKQPGKSVEEIAKLLYDKVARVICDENGINLDEWDGVDHNGYLAVAKEIKR